ncbi:TPA: hypothetical protein JG862_004639 [Enterobacter hormaechei subsp. steigerwaltii]|nr:hypothetical protein [Enterobacter hormaechei subsp. steigerwaltii]
MQRQQDGKPGQSTALMICFNVFNQFRQPLQRQGVIVVSREGSRHAIKICCRVAVDKSLMDRMAHDVTEVPPRAGRDFQQALFLNAFLKVNEMTRFKLRDGRMTNYRKFPDAEGKIKIHREEFSR